MHRTKEFKNAQINPKKCAEKKNNFEQSWWFWAVRGSGGDC